jgi:hypothetical protein
MAAQPTSATAVRVDNTTVFFIAVALQDVVYHADRSKEKCKLQRKATVIHEMKSKHKGADD